MKAKAAGWCEGLAVWTDEESRTAFISCAFTWKLKEVAEWARYYLALGYRVRAGGPGLFAFRFKIPAGKHLLSGLVELGGDIPDAVAHQNPDATRASSGCPETMCNFCIVPAFEGREFTLYPDFQVRPILIDNNLSGLPIEYQRHIVARYRSAGIPLLDANSGFEPKSFDPDCFALWSEINRGPWRFGYDQTRETAEVLEVMTMLRGAGVPAKKIRPYVIIGNEPFDQCMARIRRVLDWGGEPHVQPYMKLNAIEREPWAQFDWTVQRLRDVARWANRRHWRKATFAEYDRTARTRPRRDRYRSSDGLFV